MYAHMYIHMCVCSEKDVKGPIGPQIKICSETAFLFTRRVVTYSFNIKNSNR